VNIPKVKPWPEGAVQCDDCGGNGCGTCGDNGWLDKEHPKGRKCLRGDCPNLLVPDHYAVYCSNECAWEDA